MMAQGSKSRLTDRNLAEQRAGVLKALGNPVRVRIVAYLCGAGETPVGSLAEALELPQSSISRQLAWLRLNELVVARKDGPFSYYSIAIPQLETLLGCLEHCCRPHGDTVSTDSGESH